MRVPSLLVCAVPLLVCATDSGTHERAVPHVIVIEGALLPRRIVLNDSWER